MSFASSLINEAKKWTYCREESKNRSVCVDKVQNYVRGYVSSDPWCAMFATMILDQTCKKYGIKNPIGLTAGTHALVNIAVSKGITVDKIPAPGSIMFFDTTQPGKRATGHVGYVVQVKSSKSIYTIEGNTEVDNTEGVGFRDRTIGSSYKFIHTEKLTSASMLLKNGLNGFSLTSIGIVVGAYIVIKYCNKK